MDHPFEIACDPGKREKVLSERGLDLMRALEVFASQEGTKLSRTSEPDGSDRFETGGYLDGRFVLMVFCVRRRVVRHVITMRHCHDAEQRRWIGALDRS